MVAKNETSDLAEEPLHKKEVNVEKDDDDEDNSVQNEKEEIIVEKTTIREKLKNIKANITVEPLFAGLIIASTLSKMAVQNLNLDKACRVKLEYPGYICDALIAKTNFTNNTEIEKNVQKVISLIETWRSSLQTAFPIVLVIIMGAWSDRTGNRKICILLPIIGDLLVSICNMISAYFFYEIPVEITIFLESIFPAITGGRVMVYLGVFSYVSDITDPKNRTFRIGLVNFCLTAGIPIGTAISGIMVKQFGYLRTFASSATIYLMVLFYGFNKLKARTKPGVDCKVSYKIKLSDFIKFNKETAVVIFKKRDGYLRIKIILTLLVVGLIYGPNEGEGNIMYLFVRNRLKWDAVTYSMYSTFNIILHAIGALFSITLLSRRLGWHDSVLCIISVTSKMIGSIYLAFVQTSFQMFCLPIVQILNCTTFTSLRSLASKLVDREEVGKINSLISLIETLGALLFDPIYAGLYLVTLSNFSSTVFLFSAAITVPAILIMLWQYFEYRKGNKKVERIQYLDPENTIKE